MKFIKIFLIASLAATLVSCATAYSGIETAAESGVTFITTWSEINVLGKRNEAFYDDSLSFEATQLVKKVIASNLVVNANAIVESMDEENLQNSISQMFMRAAATSRGNLTDLRVPADVLQFARRSSPDRFAVFVWHDGFTREKGGFGREMALAAGLAVASAVLSGGYGYSSYIPTKADSRLSLLVLDTQAGRIADFRVRDEEAEPLRENVITRELETALKRIFR